MHHVSKSACSCPIFEALCTDSVVESGPNIGWGTDTPLQVIYACDYTEEREVGGVLIKRVNWYQCPDLRCPHPDIARQDIVEWHDSQGVSIGWMRWYPCTDLRHADPDTNGQALCPPRLDSSQEPGKEDEIDMEFGGSDTEESAYCTPFFSFLWTDRHQLVPGLTTEWNARTPQEVYHHQHGIARYWEHGTEPNVLSPEYKKVFENKKTWFSMKEGRSHRFYNHISDLNSWYNIKWMTYLDDLFLLL